jgi:hypothetical protein
MLDTFLKLIDRLIQLAKLRTDRRKNVFSEIYKPLFAEMEKIHLDYITTFSACLRQIDDEAFIRNIIATIDEKRIPLLPAREKVKSYVTAMRPADGHETPELTFAKSIAHYFAVPIPWFSRASAVGAAMRLLEDPTVGGIVIPVASESEADKYLTFANAEAMFTSYGVVHYVQSHEATSEDQRREIVSQILSNELETLGNRWA